MILDACVVLAYLLDEPAADDVEAMLAAPVPDRSLTAIGLAEVVDQYVRVAGCRHQQAMLDLAALGLLDPVAVTGPIGAAAGRLRAHHYHRRHCVVSHADCIAAEAARRTNRPLVTSDADLLDVCAAAGIPTVRLPSPS